MSQARELKKGWLGYAIGLNLLLFGILWMSLQQPYTIWDYVDIPMTIGALAGVYGYAFGARWARPWVWMAMLVAILLWDLVYNFVLRTFEHWGVQDQTGLFMLLGFGFVVFLPEYVALYLYGRSRDPIWAGATSPRV